MVERLLILGGTAEAAALARAATAAFGDALEVTTSLAGRLPDRPDLPGRLRVGGFGGADGLASFLRAEQIDRLIDATHPFAAVISRHAAEACAQADVPRLVLIRAAWTQQPGDRWIDAGDLGHVAALLPGLARRVFLATGPGGIEAFASVPGVWFLVRVFAPPAEPLPLPDHATIVARPPFTIAGETAMLETHRIEAVVTKNSGGPTEAKLAAARALALPVVMIRRPPAPPGGLVERVEDALAWLARRQ